MALIKRRIVRFTGTVTTDGLGNAAVDVAQGSAGGVAPISPSYKLIRADVKQDATNPIAVAGTINVRDNSGAGSAVNYTLTVTATPTLANDIGSAAGAAHIKTLNAPTPVTNVRFTVAGGGATKSFQYRLVFARTRAH